MAYGQVTHCHQKEEIELVDVAYRESKQGAEAPAEGEETEATE